MKEFDDKASTWDEDPSRLERAKVIAKKIRHYLKEAHFSSAMEYGSGTGLLGYELLDLFDKITFMDESKEMTRITLEKSRVFPDKIIEVLEYDLINDPLPAARYDLIFSMLTLHHIDDTKLILDKFHSLLNPGGLLAIIDLEKEDGSFHTGEFHGHLGFEKEALDKSIRACGFRPLQYEIIYTINKEISNGSKKDFPLFFLLSEKK
jgi:SAM-dependent methyltransferase